MQRNNKVLYQFFMILSPVCSLNGYKGQNSVSRANLTVVNRQISSMPLKLIQITDNIRIGLNCLFSQNIF